jgi:phosphoribosyl-AMP cyclohydrolase
MAPAHRAGFLSAAVPSLFRVPGDRFPLNDATQTGPDFAASGVLPAIAQDAESGEVLMLAYMNAESYAETLRTGRAVYFSRSRGRLWRKGEASGHVQLVREIYVDCDADTILLKVDQQGPGACHEGYKSCFFRRATPAGLEVVTERVFDPEKVYKAD